MRNRFFAVALAACIPVVVFAQRGGGSSSAPSSDIKEPSSSRPSGGMSGAKTPSSRDFADLNPASLLVDKKKKISLADSTVAQLKALSKQIDDRNKAFFSAYDSVRKWTIPLASGSAGSASRPGFQPGDAQLATSTSSAAEQAKMQSSLRDLRQMMNEFKTRRKTDTDESLKLVPEAQKKGASDLIAQQDGDLDKLIGAGRP
jgi:hypothetical protein